MFTSTAKQLFSALGKGAQPVVQGLANCEQPLSHRGPVNLSPAKRGSRDGTYDSNPWPVQDAPLPPAGETAGELPSSPAPWNSYNTGFYFPTDQYFTQNQFFGGPTLHVTGDSYADNSVAQTFEGDTVNATNINVDVINGEPQGGPPGAPGLPGADGIAGAPGFPGVNGFFGLGRFRRMFYLDGRNPRVDVNRIDVATPHRYARDGWIRPLMGVTVPLGAIAGGTVTIAPSHTVVTAPAAGTVSVTPSQVSVSIPAAATVAVTPASVSVSIPSGMSVSVTPSPVSFSIPTGVTFNPDTCEVSFLGYETVTVAGTGSMSGSVSINSYATVTVGADTPVSAPVVIHEYATVTVGGTASMTSSLVISEYSTATVAGTSAVTADLATQSCSAVSIHAFSSTATSSYGATTAVPGNVGGVVVRLDAVQTPQAVVVGTAVLRGVARESRELLHRN